MGTGGADSARLNRRGREARLGPAGRGGGGRNPPRRDRARQRRDRGGGTATMEGGLPPGVDAPPYRREGRTNGTTRSGTHLNTIVRPRYLRVRDACDGERRAALVMFPGTSAKTTVTHVTPFAATTPMPHAVNAGFRMLSRCGGLFRNARASSGMPSGPPRAIPTFSPAVP